MLFTSWDFARFLAIVLPVYWLLQRSLKLQNSWLLLASLVFYGWVAPWWLIPMTFTTLLDWSCSLGIDRIPRHRNKFLAASMIGNLGMLATFKYFNFFAENAATALHALGFDVSAPVLRVVLPAGISFYTLQEMSYTIDVWRREIPARRSLLDFSLFVTFFPHLVAGPIQRASKLLTQVEQPRRWVTERILSAFPLLVTGFFKKVVVADNVAGVVDRIFMLDSPSTPVVLAGSLAFSAQIFCDFSGYSDIARGAARLFGFELIENFRAPYLARTLDDFWRRWHISLSSWIRDYLYIPLGGNRRKTALGRYVVLIATMAISGLWHGAAWTFVVWGLWHGIGLAIVRATGLGREWAERSRAGALVSWAATFAWVVVGFGLFRAHNLVWFVRGLTRGGLANRGELLAATSVVATTAALAIPGMLLYAAIDVLPRARWVHSALRWSLVALVVLLAKEGGREFIYFQF